MKRNFLTSIMTCIIGSLTLSIAASMASATNWDNRTVIRKERKELRAWDSPRRLRYSPEAQLKTVQSVSRWAAPAIQSEDTEWKTVVEEDFSLFSAGSETEPDMTNILSSEGYLLYDYVHTYGWTGISVYQAGGSVTALPATEVSDAGFRANWTTAENAAFYELTTLSYYTVPSSGTLTLEDEDFSRVTEGTETEPVYGPIQGALEGYTEYDDWSAITPVLANGMVGMKNYYMVMGYYSMLYTPIYYVISKTASTITLQIDVKRVDCSAETKVGVNLVNASTNEGGDWQFRTLTENEMTLTFEFEPIDTYYLAIGFDDPNNADYGSTGVVYVDHVKVTQNELSAGDQIVRIYAYDMVYNESYYVGTDNKRPSEQFSYYVMAITNGESDYLYSNPSNEIVVGETGSVDELVTPGVKAYGADGTVYVETDMSEAVEVYDLTGIRIARQEVSEGTTGIAMPQGLYLVRLGNSVAKVLVK